jgi:YbaB/EbfC DNA-binding family
MDHLTALATDVAARIRRTQAAVDELQRRLPRPGSQVSSSGDEVVVSVNEHGRLVELQLASGLTARMTCAALECLINDTLRTAVDLAVRTDRRLMSA